MPQSYSGQDLRKQHFAGQDLRGRDFSDADLREANFAGATLYEANFSGANVRGANFTKAKLDKADFSNAKIQGANFHQAKLRSTKFPKASVDDTSSLPSVDFSKAEIQGTNFTDALLNHADFTAVQAGLTRFWSFVLYGIHIFLCLISAFTTTISITFLIYFFRASNKKPSFLDSIFIGITSVVIIVILRTFLLNYYRVLVFPSVMLGIIAIVIVFFVALVTAITSEEDGFFSSIMTVVLLFIILIITTKATIFAGFEDSLPKELGHIIFNLGSQLKNNQNGTNGTWISTVLVSIVGAIFGCWFSRSAINENTQFNWLWKIYVRLTATGGTTFNQADLTNAFFTSANLKGGNFKNAIITGVLWYRVKSLERARVGNDYLKFYQVRELVVRLDGKGQNFNNLNLEGINLETPNLSEASNSLERTNLSSASFVGTNLNKANLQGVNLEKANLKQAKLNGANLTKACLTGAIIEDWNIDQTTILSNVKCEFIFLKEHPDPNSGIQKRLPHPPSIFKPGDFEKIFIGERNTVKLFIRHEQNRQALTAAFEHLIKNNPDITPDDFREFRRIDDDDVLVTIRVPQYTFEGVVEQEFEQVYQQVKQESPSNSRSGEFENQPLFEFILKLIKTIGENMNEKREITFHGNDSRYIENNGTYVERDYINMSQDLTKAASQIQDLIEQLQKRGVTVDVAQTQVAENIATQAKKDSTMKEKLAKWGQSLGDATVSDVVKGVVKLAIRSAGIPLP